MTVFLKILSLGHLKILSLGHRKALNDGVTIGLKTLVLY